MKTRFALLPLLLLSTACGSRTANIGKSSSIGSDTGRSFASASPTPSASPSASASPATGDSGSVSATRSDSIGFESLASGASKIKTAGNRVISDRATYEKFWEEHSGTGSLPPEVDFGTETVLAVFFGQKSTGGYSIRITSVKLSGSELVVSYHETEPEKGKLNSQVLNAPAHIVKISKSKASGDFTSSRFVSE